MRKLTMALQMAVHFISHPEAKTPEIVAAFNRAFNDMIALSKQPEYTDVPSVQKDASTFQRALDAVNGAVMNDAERDGLIFDLVQLGADIEEHDLIERLKNVTGQAVH